MTDTQEKLEKFFLTPKFFLKNEKNKEEEKLNELEVLLHYCQYVQLTTSVNNYFSVVIEKV